jgi:glycosyltransferase involved in cell wall biosynthesis
MKLSACIPYYESHPEKVELLNKCVESLVGHDEIIILAGKQKSLAAAINKLFVMAHGDYVLITNDDLTLESGNLSDLCIPGVVTSPKVNGFVREFSGHMFCVPKTVLELVGGYDERYTIAYFDDDDFIMNLKAHNVKIQNVPSVNVLHPVGGTTLHTYPNWQEFFEENRLKFNEKWGTQR